MAEFIEEDSARGAQARAQTGEEASKFSEEFASIGIQLGARYDGSPIVVADGSDPPVDDPFIYRPTGCPGGRAPHLWMPDGSSLFDHFGRGFTLLLLTGAKDGAAAMSKAAAKRGFPLQLLAIESDAARELYGANYALVRPDQHVAWRGNRLPENPEALLATVSGH
ncbi:MAG: hypothetical protein EXR28_10420 [Betaproteobacteria bacterium]|nr:hypothetical protein [Betaproteobacteria bacterium]